MEAVDGLKIVYLPISALTPYERNAKEHPPEQIEQIKKSIQDYGMDDPIGIWGENNIIVEGHGRLLACKALGFTEVPCIRLDHMTDAQRQEYALVHNQTTMNSGLDLDVLDLELGDLLDFDAEFYGFEIDPDFTDSELEAFMDKEVNDRAREVHRVICDCNNEDETRIVESILKDNGYNPIVRNS